MSDITPAILFARNCIRESERAAARGEHLLAAMLREPASRVVAETNAAMEKYRAPPSPAQERTRATLGRSGRSSGRFTDVADLEIIYATIPAGQTVSAPVAIGFKGIVGLIMPIICVSGSLLSRRRRRQTR